MYHLAAAFPFVRRVRIPFSRDQFMLLLAAVNEIILGVDIYLAHNIDGTIKPYEWIPIIFGPAAGVLLLAAGIIAIRRRPLANIIATGVFFLSIIVGLLGTYFHLHRAFLWEAASGQRISAHLLIWAPPLLGPITFALVAVLGLSAAWVEDPPDSGVLQLLGGRRLRMPYPKTQAYFFMVSLFILVTLIMSVLDHARTNFENPWLWFPTIVGTLAVLVTFLMGAFSHLERNDLLFYIATMLLLIIVGLVGFVLHILANLTGQGAIVPERFLRGAPSMAPLLFANMALMGLLVLLDPVAEKKPNE